MYILKHFFYYTICVKLTIIIAIIIIFNTTPAHAQNAEINAGFVNKIWYSQNQFFAGDMARIYTAFQNNTSFDIVGKMQFYDSEKLISETNFESVAGQLIQKWADWKATAGEHNIKIKIIEAKKSLPGKTPELIELPPNTQTISDARAIDLDTDNDGIGNKEDDDDDNDGISDVDEIKKETDPLVVDKEKLVETKREETVVQNITQKITNILQNTAENESNQPNKSFIPPIISDKISFATTPISDGMIGQVVAVLEEKRDEAKQIIQSGQTDKPIFWNSLNKISEKYPQIEKIIKALPAKVQVQYRALAITAFILKTPWVLALTGLALFVFLWKLTKIFT